MLNATVVTESPDVRWAVLGTVQKTGLDTVDPTRTRLDAVARGGGPATGGNLNGVKLLRGGQATRLRLEGGIKGHTLEEIGVRSGDQIIVPHKFLSRDNMFLFLQVVQIAVSVAVLAKLY